MNGHGLFFRFAMTRPGEMARGHRNGSDGVGLGLFLLVLCSGVGAAVFFLA